MARSLIRDYPSFEMERGQTMMQARTIFEPAVGARRSWRARPARGAYLIGLAALILAMLPYIVGFLFVPHGQVFLGIFNNELDVSQYLAALRQGTQGQVLFTNQYTDKAASPVLMYILYTLMGLLTRALHVSAIALYDTLLVVGLMLVLVGGWLLCRAFHPRRPFAAYLVLLFAGGLYVPRLYHFDTTQALYSTRLLLDGNDSTLLAALQLPHAAWALAAEMGIMLVYLRWRRTARPRLLAGLALLAVGLGLLTPFLLLTVYGTLGLHVSASWTHRRVSVTTERPSPTLTVSDAAALAIALAPSLALPLYYNHVFAYDPIWSRTLMRDPEPPHLVTVCVCYGMLVLALLLAWQRDRRFLHRPGVALLLSWVLITLMLVALPLPQPHRYLLGLPIPLSLLCVYAGAGLSRRVRVMAAAILCASSVATILTLTWIAAGQRYAGYYLDAGVEGVVSYLATHTTANDVVLGPERLCDLDVGSMPARVVLWHYYETPDILAVRRGVATYDAAATSDMARARFEKAHHVTLLIVAPGQSALLGATRHTARYRQLYAANGYTVLRVESDAFRTVSRAQLSRL